MKQKVRKVALNGGIRAEAARKGRLEELLENNQVSNLVSCYVLHMIRS